MEEARKLGEHRRSVALNYALMWRLKLQNLRMERDYLSSAITSLEAEPEGETQYQTELISLSLAVGALDDAIRHLARAESEISYGA